MLTARFVGLEHLFRPACLQQKVKHVGGLDSSQQQAHWSVVLALVGALQVLMELIIFHQATAVQRDHTL